MLGTAIMMARDAPSLYILEEGGGPPVLPHWRCASSETWDFLLGFLLGGVTGSLFFFFFFLEEVLLTGD